MTLVLPFDDRFSNFDFSGTMTATEFNDELQQCIELFEEIEERKMTDEEIQELTNICMIDVKIVKEQTGTLYVEPVTLVLNLATALNTAASTNELAIWDNTMQREIRTATSA
jgi:hypothetical protein